MQAIRRIIPWILILTAPAVMLYPLWTNPLSAGEDDVIYYYPLRKMVAEHLREGCWPIHNPLEATGSALMADPQSAVLFPATWLFAVMDMKLAYSLSIFLSFSIAGSGAYLYLRRLGLLRVAGTFGAMAFMFCGFMVGHRVHLAMIQTAAFLPWGLWCIELLRRRGGAGFAWMVPVVFLAIAAGHWAILTYMGLLWGVYLLVRGRPLIRSVGIAAAALVLGAAMAAPQLHSTWELMGQATRSEIGYAEFGENSFFPAAAVLALFPMLMGSRAPNFFPQRWWGPWHLCEMLGYIGLVTMVLAVAAAWRLYRREMRGVRNNGIDSNPVGPEGANPAALRGLVKCWAWMAVGAGVWMLGYYLPMYRLVHLVPVLKVVRCPARMILVVDMGLATLGAITVHVMASRGGRSEALRRTIRRVVTVVLPLIMLGTLAVLGAAVSILILFLPDHLPWFSGKPIDALAALRPDNPAVWVPFALLIATVVAVRLWLRAPRRGAVVLVGVLLADLFFITRFVDVPPVGVVAPDPEASPAAAWLREHAPKNEPFRIYSLGRSYHDRPGELLLPKTGQSLGFETIASYGPWHSGRHAHLLGFNHYGFNHYWESLVRRNHLLSLYNVRYILAADREHREVIESVRIPLGPPSTDAPNVLTDNWQLKRAEFREGILHLGTPLLWRVSCASQPVRLEPGKIYRTALDVRTPEGPLGDLLRAQIRDDWKGYSEPTKASLELHGEQVGRDWRHFEWTFRAPEESGDKAAFVINTASERVLQIRNVRLHQSQWDIPIDMGGRLLPGEKVYRELVRLTALNPQDPPVVIYENRLCFQRRQGTPMHSDEIEALKWHTGGAPGAELPALPDISLMVRSDPSKLLIAWSFPGGVVYLLVVGAGVFIARKKK